MRDYRYWTLWVTLAWCVGATGCFAQETTSHQLRRHALLVGCSDYENLDEFYQLRGPVNDVHLMRQLLIDRFEFDPQRDDIVILAASEDADHQPTRANIKREFLRLGDTVKASEPIVILLGGHGSQQPDNDPSSPADPESDGMDEIFLPCDVGKWDGDSGSVENAILDDDLREWLSNIISKEAFVWLIMDACHSGSGVRGSDAEVSRHIPPDKLVPDQALAAAESAASQTEDKSGDSLFDGPGGLVAIYAAQPHETTPERRLPLGADPTTRKYYGLLTFTISEILSNTNRSLTYNELVQAVQSRYITMGRRAPTPLIEGSHRDNLVLGREAFPARSRILLERRQPLAINVGALQTITNGSILAVYPPIGQEPDHSGELLGHVRVTRVDMTSAEVEPCEFGKMAAPEVKDLPNRARCEVVYRDLGQQRLRVMVDRHDADGETLPPSIHKRLMSTLRDEVSQLVAVVDQTGDADWLLRYGDREIQLVPTEGISEEDKAGHRQSLAPHSVTGGWAEEVMGNLERIARARNLLRLTSAASEKPRGGDLGFTMSVLDDAGKSIAWQSDGRTLEDGQRVTVVVDNAGKQSVDVTLLYVDSAYGVACLFPNVGEINRLGPGENQSIRLTINAETSGLEHLVAIVVKADRQPVDFSILAQPSLELAQRTRGGDDALETPLGRLCRTALYGTGNTRGVSRTDTQDYDINVLTWRIQP